MAFTFTVNDYSGKKTAKLYHFKAFFFNRDYISEACQYRTGGDGTVSGSVVNSGPLGLPLKCGETSGVRCVFSFVSFVHTTTVVCLL